MTPLVVVLIPIGIILWPPVLLLTGLAYLLLWPLAALARRRASPHILAMHATRGRWFRTLLTPWNYFDTPDAGSATRSAPPEE